jgi:hypothetical protein
LKGNLDEERIKQIAVSLNINKELESKLYPEYCDRYGLIPCTQSMIWSLPAARL